MAATDVTWALLYLTQIPSGALFIDELVDSLCATGVLTNEMGAPITRGAIEAGAAIPAYTMTAADKSTRNFLVSAMQMGYNGPVPLPGPAAQARRDAIATVAPCWPLSGVYTRNANVAAVLAVHRLMHMPGGNAEILRLSDLPAGDRGVSHIYQPWHMPHPLVPGATLIFAEACLQPLSLNEERKACFEVWITTMGAGACICGSGAFPTPFAPRCKSAPGIVRVLMHFAVPGDPTVWSTYL